jgi:hypothetical protein
MYAAYAALGRLQRQVEEEEEAPPPPASLVLGARLFYGAHEVLVQMPAVAGSPASHEQATGGCAAKPADSSVLAAVADAVAWLARHCILYTDLRGPNVLLPEHLPQEAQQAQQAGQESTGGSGGGGRGSSSSSSSKGLPAAWLIDYDDCIALQQPVSSLAGFSAALQAVEQVRAPRRGLSVAPPGFAQCFLEGRFPHLSAALHSSFERLAQRS